MYRIVVSLCALSFLLLVAEPVRAAEGTPRDVTLSSVLDECSALKLAMRGAAVRDKTISVGGMDLTFDEGTLVPVLGRTGTVLGAYFQGRGKWLYTASDRTDSETLSVNVERLLVPLRVRGDAVADELRTALVLSSDPSFLGAEAGGDVDTPRSASAEFERMLVDVKRTGASSQEFDFRVAQALLNRRGAWTYAEMSGGRHPVGFFHDDVAEGLEELMTFRKRVDFNVRFREPLVITELRGWDRTRRQDVVLTHADISLATQDNKSGDINSDLTFHVRQTGTRLIPLGLMNNRDPDSANWNSPRQALTVTHVRDADGHDLVFSHKYHELVVEIPPTPAPESDVRLRFETTGDVFLDSYERHTDNVFSVIGYAWYPSPTGLAGQRFTYSLRLKFKKPWTAITSGIEVARMDDGKFETVQARSDQPSTLIAIMAGNYFSGSATQGPYQIHVHSYAWNRKEVLENLPKLTGAILDLYTNLLGPLRMEDLDVVEVPPIAVGQSPSGMALITNKVLSNVHSSSASGANFMLARELALQWFAHKAIPMRMEDEWLGDSFAAYFAAIAVGTLAPRDGVIKKFDDLLLDWRTNERLCADGGSIAAARSLGGDDGRRDGGCLLWSRGPLVLHMLRTTIGNERFFAAVKAYLDRADYGPATTEDFQRSVSEAAGEDMRWFFDQWVRRRGDAEVTVEQRAEATGPGEYRLRGTLRQLPGERFRKMLVPLVWECDGSPEAHVVRCDTAETKFDLPICAKRVNVRVDPYQNNLAVYK